jgi:2-C-methyl-D-erythritol 4-phosphate cytidylyltransferase/2-C-methyl-D-erythritol 2,4-cyclodiphosphate synthase
MLKIINQLLKKKSARLINLDITIICQKPKILKYKELMREEIAGILEVQKSRINIKATTTEELGFLGRSEGLAAQAATSIVIAVSL